MDSPKTPSEWRRHAADLRRQAAACIRASDPAGAAELEAAARDAEAAASGRRPPRDFDALAGDLAAVTDPELRAALARLELARMERKRAE